MKIALVHDYLPNWGGAESVLATLHEMWPEAPIYTIFSNVGKGKDKILDEKFKKAKIITSWFDKIPFRQKLMSPCRFLLPLIWGGFSARGGPAFGWDFSKYDLVISSASWAITKGFGEVGRGDREKPVEICYCHTPPRILYGYETSRNWQKHWYFRAYALITSHFLRQYDFQQAQKVTQFIANSSEVQKRIKKFYRRDSVVVNPPVEIVKFEARSQVPGGTRRSTKHEINPKIQNTKYKIQDTEYFLTGGRLERAKNFDLIIKAFNQLKLPLKVYGIGTQENYLRQISGPTVEFLGPVSLEKRTELMRNCRAFIAAATDEDFGITPVEAMATGRPVIAYRGGGYLDTVIEGETGIFFDEATVKGVVKSVRDFEKVEGNMTEGNCIKRASDFSRENFIRKFNQLVNSLIKEG